MTAADCAVTADMTVTLRDLTLHHHDPPFVLIDFNPWVRPVRVESEQGRAWADGAWSAAEWNDAVTHQLTILVRDDDDPIRRGTRRWLDQHHAVAAAFAASSDDLPLDFTVANPDTAGGLDEYVIYGRPRGSEPAAATGLRGWTLVRAWFRQLDPLIYSGGAAGLHTATTGLASATGGLTIPVTAPFTIGATVTSGSILITNAGTATTPLQFRIDGPVSQPRITLITPTGTTYVLRYYDDLATGQWLDLDTRARTALLNGTVSRRGLVTAEPDNTWPMLPPGTSELQFTAGTYNPAALLTVTWRDAWIA